MADVVKGNEKPKTRYRQISAYGGRRIIHSDTYLNGNKISSSEANQGYSSSGRQVTTSEGHPFRSSKRKGEADIGGDFFTQKRFVVPFNKERFRVGSVTSPPFFKQSVYRGPILAIDPIGTAYPPDSTSSNGQLDSVGATAIARVKPTNPVASLTAALVELRREGLPSLAGSTTWRSRAVTVRNAGDEYLNVQFGWKPLINDVTKFTSGASLAGTVIKQYKQGIGKPTRRGYNFPTTRTTTTTLIGTGNPWGPSGYSDFFIPSSTPGTIYRERSIVQRRWFSGAFTYFFPHDIFGSEKLADYAILAHQLGLEPTPEVLWQVTPWSWAVDWFSNTGDVISNWTSFHIDGLVMLYGYMMEHTIVTDTYSMYGFRIDGKDVQVDDVSKVVETKIRRGANPYGFGVSWSGLSAFQTSILAALGVTKGRR